MQVRETDGVSKTYVVAEDQAGDGGPAVQVILSITVMEWERQHTSATSPRGSG
jgi:hypothetical protein